MVAGATYAVLGGTVERIEPDEVDAALADGKVTVSPLNLDGFGPVMLRIRGNDRAGLRWVAAAGNELREVHEIGIMPSDENGWRDMYVIGMPQESNA